MIVIIDCVAIEGNFAFFSILKFICHLTISGVYFLRGFNKDFGNDNELDSKERPGLKPCWASLKIM